MKRPGPSPRPAPARRHRGRAADRRAVRFPLRSVVSPDFPNVAQTPGALLSDRISRTRAASRSSRTTTACCSRCRRFRRASPARTTRSEPGISRTRHPRSARDAGASPRCRAWPRLPQDGRRPGSREQQRPLDVPGDDSAELPARVVHAALEIAASGRAARSPTPGSSGRPGGRTATSTGTPSSRSAGTASRSGTTSA